jgi:hypothetical protein
VNGNGLEQLLRDADGTMPPSPPPPRPTRDLAESVRRLHRDRRARRARAGAATALLACVALSGWLVYPPQQARRFAQPPGVSTNAVATNTTPPVDREHARAAYLRLVAEADRRESIAARVQQWRARTSADRPTLGELRVELQREEATLLLLQQGDLLARDPALRNSAAVAYRQAVELFPGTSGADAAKARLETIN